ncbi:MAG: type II toxin-antitoxin system VapC family toxin [Sulfuritalea sp.]|nr:type II toxin-antitoxin system VapC family toxin [Sulfuritalea sp.]
MGFIVDASVGAGWIIKNQVSEYSEAAKRALLTDPVVVPALWWLEMTNLLRTGCRRRTITAVEAHGFIKTLEALPIRIESLEPNPSELLGLGLRHDLSAYGAVYLDLALRLQLPLATQDAALREAALASGVGVWMPG